MLDVSQPLDVLGRKVLRRVPQPLELLVDRCYLVLESVDIVGLAINEVEEPEVALLGLDELGHQDIRVFDVGRLFDLRKGLFKAKHLLDVLLPDLLLNHLILFILLLLLPRHYRLLLLQRSPLTGLITH